MMKEMIRKVMEWLRGAKEKLPNLSEELLFIIDRKSVV